MYYISIILPVLLIPCWAEQLHVFLQNYQGVQMAVSIKAELAVVNKKVWSTYILMGPLCQQDPWLLSPRKDNSKGNMNDM